MIAFSDALEDWVDNAIPQDGGRVIRYWDPRRREWRVAAPTESLPSIAARYKDVTVGQRHSRPRVFDQLLSCVAQWG